MSLRMIPQEAETRSSYTEGMRTQHGSALVVEEVEKYFPMPRRGGRAFVDPFGPLTQAALRGISFRVESGEIAALIGANGSGKSPLLRILAALLLPTRGRAFVAGHNVEE